MNKDKLLAVIKRELKANILSKTFVIMTLLIPGIIILSIGLQVYIKQSAEDTKKQIVVVSESPEVISALKNKLTNEEKENNFVFEFKTMNKSRFENELEKLKPLLLDESLTGVVFIPKEATQNKKVIYYAKIPGDRTVNYKLKKEINSALVSIYLSKRGISQKDLEYANKSVTISEMKVTSEKIEKKNKGSEILAFLFIFLLYMSLITSGQIILRSVIEEKQNRIVEILLSSLNPKEILSGKIIVITITSLTQMLIWLTPVIIALSTSWIVLPEEITVNIPVWHWLFFFFNFILGLIIFLSLFAAMGSLFDNEQDAQSGMWPLMLLIMVPFFIAIAIAENPTNTLAQTLSLFPLTSIFIMPERVSFSEVPFYEILISITGNFITLILLILLSAKIYRTGILMTGKRPSWSEVIRWIRAK